MPRRCLSRGFKIALNAVEYVKPTFHLLPGDDDDADDDEDTMRLVYLVYFIWKKGHIFRLRAHPLIKPSLKAFSRYLYITFASVYEQTFSCLILEISACDILGIRIGGKTLSAVILVNFEFFGSNKYDGNKITDNFRFNQRRPQLWIDSIWSTQPANIYFSTKIVQCTLVWDAVYTISMAFCVDGVDECLCLSVSLSYGRYLRDGNKWIFNSAQHPLDHNHLWFTIRFIEMVNICMLLVMLFLSPSLSAQTLRLNRARNFASLPMPRQDMINK